MKYALMIYKECNWHLEKIYDEEVQAQKKIEKSFSKAKVQPKIIKVPDVKPGLKLYRFKDGVRYYGTIVKECKSIYFVNNTENPYDTPNPWLKETFIDKFLNGVFMDGIEEYDERFFGNVNTEDFDNDTNLKEEQ